MSPRRAAPHPLVAAVQPLLDRVGAAVVPAADVREGDVPLVWEGEVVVHVRVADPAGEREDAGTTDLGDALDRLVAEVEAELGSPLADLDRRGKQHAVRLLEQRGAFTLRRSVETVAGRLGVSRFTVYNYLNRERASG